MSLKRYAAKRDKNEREIIHALEGVGAKVVQISQEGIPDLLVLFRSRVYLIEVKTKTGTLTSAEQDFFEYWDDDSAAVARTVDDALALIGAT